MLFEKAARLKLRFNHKGLCTVEDLWDMSLESLDMIFKEMNASLKGYEGESLLGKKSDEDKILALRIDIVRHVVKTKLTEQEARENALAKAARKQQLLGVIATKQDAELHDMSVDDLKKLVDEL